MNEDIRKKLMELSKEAMNGNPVKIPIEITRAIDEEYGLSEWLQKSITEVRKREYIYRMPK